MPTYVHELQLACLYAPISHRYVLLISGARTPYTILLLPSYGPPCDRVTDQHSIAVVYLSPLTISPTTSNSVSRYHLCCCFHYSSVLWCCTICLGGGLGSRPRASCLHLPLPSYSSVVGWLFGGDV